MYILGLSSHYHDSAACLIHRGEIVAAAQEERFSRRKHDARFPKMAIEYCLQSAGVSLREVSAVVYYEKPLLKFDRLMESYFYSAPLGLSYFVESLPVWLKHKLFMRQTLIRALKKMDSRFNAEKLFFSEHHLSHGASAFYPSPFEEAVVLTLDGVGEWATTSVAIGRGKNLEIKKEIHFPHSLGMFYSAFTTFCGFKVNSGEYKLMGLAPYGQPRYADVILEKMIELNPDGSYSLHLEYFDFIKGQSMYSKKFIELFGIPPRAPEGKLEPIHMDIAASVQLVLEKVLIHLVRHIRAEYNIDQLCMAGGVALNCVANSQVFKENFFKNIWIQPAAGDAGGALGGALAFYYLHLKNERTIYRPDAMKNSFLGPSYSDESIESVLIEAGLNYQKLSPDQLVRQSAEFLSQGKSLGWFQGAMEFGPRALGARSILADPRSADMQTRLNLQIKFRESFRPFAPLVLEEDVEQWFDWKTPSPYMLFVAKVAQDLRLEDVQGQELFGIERLKRVRSKIPAVTHVDYSSRLQTLGPQSQPQLRQMLMEFKKITGCPVVVNTSFNVRGEPIVCTPQDAVKCFLGTGLDGLAIGHFFLKKESQSQQLLVSYHREFDLD